VRVRIVGFFGCLLVPGAVGVDSFGVAFGSLVLLTFFEFRLRGELRVLSSDCDRGGALHFLVICIRSDDGGVLKLRSRLREVARAPGLCVISWLLRANDYSMPDDAVLPLMLVGTPFCSVNLLDGCRLAS
jgi:hypothetical protein